jgi:hypothetical protein
VFKTNAVKLAGIVSEVAISNNIIELQVTYVFGEIHKGKIYPIVLLVV